MKAYIDLLFKKQLLFKIILVITILVSLAGIVQLKLNTNFSSFSPDESIYQDRLDETTAIFGELNQLMVIVEVDSINRSSLDDIYTLQNKLSNIVDISFIQGAAPNELMINGSAVGFGDIPSETVIAYYENFGDFSPIKVSEDTNYFVFTLFISPDFTNASIKDIENTLNESSYISYISGDSYNQLKITDYIIKILLILPPLALLVIFLVFRSQMGAFKPTLLSLLPAGIGSLWTFGLIGWIGNEVSILTAVVPIFIIVIGSADGLHFMSHYQDVKAMDKDDKTALLSTLKLVGIPMIVTTLTSIAGFLSLLSMNTSSIKDLSIYSAVGILLAGVATWYVLPLILSHGLDVSRKKKTPYKFNFLQKLKKVSGIPSLIVVLVILIITVFSFSHINNEFNMLMLYKDSTIVAQNAAKVSEINGGSIPVYVSLNTESDVITLDALHEVSLVVDKLNTLDEVNKVVNPFELIQIVYASQFSGDIPNDLVLANFYTTLSSDPNSTINDLISSDSNVVRLLIFPANLENDTLDVIETSVDDLNLDTNVTGVQYLMKDLNDSISQMQINSIILALSIVIVMLIITLKSFKIALFSMIPIVITVISLYGFLGLSGIPLNITTVIIFSITIGVGIDYAVHFSSLYKYYLKDDLNDLAIEKAYKSSSRPIITNALGISLGFSILMFSPLTIHFNVSVLMWVSMVVSVFLTLTLLPFIFHLARSDSDA